MVQPSPVRAGPLAPFAADASTISLAADLTSRTLADLLCRIVAATEEHDPHLAVLDSNMKQLDAEMKDIRFSVGWELEIVKREMKLDAERRDVRQVSPGAPRATTRNPHYLLGDYDREESDFIIRLTRSFLGPDHEKYVKIGERRLEKMGFVIEKQKVRRDLHMATLRAILSILYYQTVLPLVSEQIAVARQQIEMLTKFQQAGEALRKDVLAAQKQLRTLEAQRLLHQNSLRLALSELREKAGDPKLALPTTVPLVADFSLPPTTFDPQDTPRYALTGRTDYLVADMRVRLADTMATYMAWYWPRVDFEVAWNEYKDHRRFLPDDAFEKDYRYDKGKGFSTELRLNVPLNLPYRGWKRYESFRAVQERYLKEMDRLRMDIENETLRAYLIWQQAHLHREVARDQLAQAEEEVRETGLLTQQLPDEVQGLAEVKYLDARLKALEARAALCDAEHQLLLAQALWDYQTGNSPIDEAVAPYEEQDRRAAERKVWLTWWTSLTK